MKSMTTKMMMAAAALVIATGVASAQQYRADIPFAFRVAGKTWAPGAYVFKVSNSSHWMVQIYNGQTLNSSLAVPMASADGPKNAGVNPILTFACGSSRCSLTQMWTGPDRPALTFSQPRLGKDEHASATEFRVVKLNGD